ncbi:MAG: hypothetical protein WC627_08965 [Legionella sp.]|jgi:hypothetical protein
MKQDSGKKKDKDAERWSFIEKSRSLIGHGNIRVKEKKTDSTDNLSEIEPNLGSILSSKKG